MLSDKSLSIRPLENCVVFKKIAQCFRRILGWSLKPAARGVKQVEVWAIGKPIISCYETRCTSKRDLCGFDFLAEDKIMLENQTLFPWKSVERVVQRFNNPFKNSSLKDDRLSRFGLLRIRSLNALIIAVRGRPCAMQRVYGQMWAIESLDGNIDTVFSLNPHCTISFQYICMGGFFFLDKNDKEWDLQTT